MVTHKFFCVVYYVYCNCCNKELFCNFDVLGFAWWNGKNLQKRIFYFQATCFKIEIRTCHFLKLIGTSIPKWSPHLSVRSLFFSAQRRGIRNRMAGQTSKLKEFNWNVILHESPKSHLLFNLLLYILYSNIAHRSPQLYYYWFET